jgi:hypothetical protein
VPTTSKLLITVPSFGDQPYFDQLLSTLNALDGVGFASREDRNLLLLEGGAVTVTIPGGGGPGTADIFWTAPFVLKGFEGPGRTDVDVPGGPITLTMGQALFADIPRPSQANPVLVPSQVGDYLSIRGSDSKVVIALFWTDGRVYFRNGSSIGGSGGSLSAPTRSREEGFVAAPAQASFVLAGSGGGTQFPVDNEPMHLMVFQNGNYEPNVNVGLATTGFPNDTVTVAWNVAPGGGEDIRIAYAFVP